jgi:hypothetical protein
VTTDEQLQRLRLDYDQTTVLIRTLTDVRFKLLAFVPTITGAAVALVGRGHSAAELLSVGSLGLVATTGIVIYELRNTELHDYALRRAKKLEQRLGIGSIADPNRPAGLYGEEPSGELTVLGVVTAAHDRGLALVYSVAIAGWSYLVAWGALHAAGAGNAQLIGGMFGATAGIFLVIEFLRVGAHSARNQSAPRAQGAPAIHER